MEPLFSPALYKQRHQFVIDFVKRNKPRKVVDLGCGECSLLKWLRFHREIEHLVGVDVNGTRVKKNMLGLAPLSAEYLQPSYHQLCVELYQGSVTQKDARLRGFDLVTSIELIEHLTLADVQRFSEVVFGYMTPVAVIVSTPNFEFNPLLPGLISRFRHSDHKFEWTRAEFRSWAQKVCLDFGYEVELTGVGQAPSGQQERVGFCSQIGVFHRLGAKDGSNVLFADDADDVSSYTLLYSVNYPSLRDNIIMQRVLLSEVLCWAEKLKSRWIQEETGERDDKEGGGAACLSQQHRETEKRQTAVCGAEMKSPVEQCWRAASEYEQEEVPGTNGQEQKASATQHRCVSVPLAELWSCSPKISTLSGSLSNLRCLLMNNPRVKLSQDGWAVLVDYQDQDHEEEGCDDLEHSDYAQASHFSHSAELEDDWEADV